MQSRVTAPPAEAVPASGGGRSRLSRHLSSVPNLLSLSRIAAVIAGFILYLVDLKLAALVLGLWAGISDYLDGIIARRTGQVTELGAAMDRLGDLLGESFAFILVLDLGALSPIFFMVYLLRELAVLTARQYVAEHKERGIALRVTFFGKLKSNFLLYGLLLILLVHADVVGEGDVRDVLSVLGQIGIWGGLAFSYISGGQYLRDFARTYDAG